MEREGEPLGVGQCSGSSCVFVSLFVRATGRKACRSMYLFSSFARTYFVVLHMIQKLLGG